MSRRLNGVYFPSMGSGLRTAIVLVFIILLTACRPASLMQEGETLELASSKENRVNVVVTLKRDGDDHFMISATFIPLDSGLHLYSKDIPQNGVEGLGRPTLFELAENTSLTALGGVIESVPAEAPNFEPKNLRVYPVGEITLSIPVALPSGSGWSNEQVRVTYMACSDTGCRPPVVGKVIEIRVPHKDTTIDP